MLILASTLRIGRRGSRRKWTTRLVPCTAARRTASRRPAAHPAAPGPRSFSQPLSLLASLPFFLFLA
eukprot:100978-Pyramimonas_sp.AAC.1